MKPSPPAIARSVRVGWTAIAEMLDLRPCIKVVPFFFELSIASKIEDFSWTTIALLSETMQNSLLNYGPRAVPASAFGAVAPPLNELANLR